MKLAFKILVLFVLIGCKPKEVTIEKTITKIDSTAVFKLREKNKELKKENIFLLTEINNVKNENTSLKNETSSSTIKYDTSKPIILETGKPPILEEIKTETKSALESKLVESEIENKELNVENTMLTNKVSDLILRVDFLENENKDLKNRITPISFWEQVKGCIYGFFAGLIIGILLRFIRFR